MADPFVAEIRMFGFYFAPTGWAQCNGQLMPLSQNTALFSLLGTIYGGDGKSTFALPDLQARAVMHPGQGPGLSNHDLGEMGGSEYVTLLTPEIPVHTHSASASASDSLTRLPGDNMPAVGIGVGMYGAPNNLTSMSPSAVAPAGSSLPHNNMQPYLTVNYCIALQGVYPQRP